MKRNSLLFGFILFAYSAIAQNYLSKSDMVKIDFKILGEKKQYLNRKTNSFMPAYVTLTKNCEKLLLLNPLSVVQKIATPPSGNKHDYMSIAPYWWPDPSKPNGLPYIRKDGEVNPETADYTDKSNMTKMSESVYDLSLGYYFAGDERFAKKAVELMHTWFVDTATRMNPHLNYGQAVKGVISGRAEGLIDSRHFIFLIDGIQLIQKSPYYTKDFDLQMKHWFTQFLQWMEQSEIGKDEWNAKNNHGIWYDAQALSYALFIKDTAHAHQILNRSIQRLEQQLDVHGYFPLEMARTTSFHYSAFILNAFTVIAQLAENLQVDLWHLKLKDQKSLELAFTTLIPFLKKEKEWVGPQIKPFDFENGFPLLLRAATKYKCDNCMEFIYKNAADSPKNLIRLL